MSWRGTLIGIAEYDNKPSARPIVVKIKSPRGSDWFVGFNCAVGPNSDNVDAGDILNIFRVRGSGFFNI